MFESLSSRRAWIEIQLDSLSRRELEVALLTESVDWNNKNANGQSLGENVALLTESVDWNCTLFLLNGVRSRRSPRGERGLKFKAML